MTFYTKLRKAVWLPLLLILAMILASCASGSGDKNQGGEPATIKVMYWDEYGFNSEFGMLFYALHPHIDIEVVSTSRIQLGGETDNYKEQFEQFIEEEKPDILMLDQEQYENFAADGRLVSLDPFITRDKYDIEGFVPGLIEFMKEKGGGELYGLTPHFSSQVIYYNKDLFDRYNIEYPQDKMSWEELLNLAMRFPTDGSDDERIYGLNIGYQSDLFGFGQMIGSTLGLRTVNPADKRITLDSDSWVQVYELAHKALNSGALYKEDPFNFSGSMSYEDFLLRNPFISGKVAMTIEGTYMMQQIKEAANAIPDKAVSNWDLVTIPVDPANPDYSHHVNFYNIFAINAESPNRDAAWEFIKYIHSDEFARVKSKSFTGQFPVRTNYMKDDEGRNLAAFYMLKPAGSNLYAGMDDLPQNFYMQAYSIGQDEMSAVENDQKTVAEALASMQTRLQAALDDAIENPDAEVEFPMFEEQVSSGAGMVITESSEEVMVMPDDGVIPEISEPEAEAEEADSGETE